MPDTSTSLSREQKAKADFAGAMSQLRPHLAETEEGRAALDALTEATLRFGTCELRMRRAERSMALGLPEADASALVESALSNNERGLTALSAVRPFAEMLAAQELDQQALSNWRDSSKEIRADWREQVSQLDIGKDDAQHLATMMNDCCSAMDEEGLRGLGQFLSRRIEQLHEARMSEDRGTHAASFPWWKIVAAAAILGMTAYAVWVAIMSGAPWWAFFLIALIASIMLLLVALGC